MSCPRIVAGGAAVADGVTAGGEGAAAGCECAAAGCEGASAEGDGVAAGTDGVALDADGVAAGAADVTAGPRRGGAAPGALDDAATEPEPAANSANASISVRTRPRRLVRRATRHGDDTSNPIQQKRPESHRILMFQVVRRTVMAPWPFLCIRIATAERI